MCLMGVAVANASCADTAVGVDAAGVDAAGAELLLDPRQPCKENRDNVANATNLKRMVRIVIALKIKYCQKPPTSKNTHRNTHSQEYPLKRTPKRLARCHRQSNPRILPIDDGNIMIMLRFIYYQLKLRYFIFVTYQKLTPKSH